jgi:ABC-type dipeptide/oligopeptide/nickel transport system permease subunit
MNNIDLKNESLINTRIQREAEVEAQVSVSSVGACPVINAPKTRPKSRPGVTKRLLQDKVAIVCLSYLGLLVLLALLAPFIAPYDYKFQDLAHVRELPTNQHIMGTDQLGRDILTRIMFGARVSLMIGISVMLVETALGVILGLLSGYLGGWVEVVVMRLADLTYAFPGLLLAILLVGMLGRDLFWLFLSFVLLGWPNIARLVRSQVLTIREREYVQSSVVSGAGFWWIVIRHILPNCASVIIISASTSVGGIMLAEAGLSFVGLGVQPPYPSLGSMISELAQLIKSRPLLIIFPSLTLSLTVVALNLLGDALRDAFDPTLSK